MLLESLRLLGRSVDPSVLLSLLVLTSVVAMIMRRTRLAFVLQMGAAAIVLVFGVLPGGTWLALPLETRFAPVRDPPSDIAGIIVLGGAQRLAISAAWGQPTLSDAMPIAALVALGRRYPKAKLVFTGGAVADGAPSTNEAQIVRHFLDGMGVADERIVYEEQSRDTLENAIFSQRLVQPNAGERWILVAEAISLPRAVGVFRRAGWNVIPFPAGYRTSGDAGITASFRLADGLDVATVAVHEWGGLLVYWLMGYTDSLFPGPDHTHNG